MIPTSDVGWKSKPLLDVHTQFFSSKNTIFCTFIFTDNVNMSNIPEWLNYNDTQLMVHWKLYIWN
jgi:hypothetical protein